MSYEEFWRPLTALYDTDEAKAIARLVFDVQYGLTMADIIMGKVETLDHQPLQALQRRLLQGEPVQYVLGIAEFGGLQFHVEPGVLIPRPETYELCQRVIGIEQTACVSLRRDPVTILDIGTGSGCIACTLAVELPKAEVTAWDISDDALRIAGGNARRLGAEVRFEKQDIRSAPDDHERWDVNGRKRRWSVMYSTTNRRWHCLCPTMTHCCSIAASDAMLPRRSSRVATCCLRSTPFTAVLSVIY